MDRGRTDDPAVAKRDSGEERRVGLAEVEAHRMRIEHLDRLKRAHLGLEVWLTVLPDRDQTFVDMGVDAVGEQLDRPGRVERIRLAGQG